MNANDQSYAESQLPAYALGALDPEDTRLVEELIASSPSYQDELRQLREVVALLPYAAPSAAPPDTVRARLFARIEASRTAAPTPPATATARRPAARWFVPGLVATLAVLVLVLGGLTLNLSGTVARLDRANGELTAAMVGLQQSLAATRDRQEALAAQFAASEERLGQVSARLAASEEYAGQMSDRMARDEYMMAFVSAPGVATRGLAPTEVASGARGEMYMYPGEASAVVIFSGLPALAPGQVYQFWLADDTNQVAGGTFEVDTSGLAHMMVEAPREVNAFSQVMVTVEPSGGSQAPSDRVVLAGSL
jgi:anti-sigma factor RsiW